VCEELGAGVGRTGGEVDGETDAWCGETDAWCGEEVITSTLFPRGNFMRDLLKLEVRRRVPNVRLLERAMAVGT